MRLERREGGFLGLSEGDLEVALEGREVRSSEEVRRVEDWLLQLGGDQEGEAGAKDLGSSDVREKGGCEERPMTAQVMTNLRQANEHLEAAQELLAEQGDMHRWTILRHIQEYLRGELGFEELAKLLCGAEVNKQLVPRA